MSTTVALVVLVILVLVGLYLFLRGKRLKPPASGAVRPSKPDITDRLAEISALKPEAEAVKTPAEAGKEAAEEKPAEAQAPEAPAPVSEAISTEEAAAPEAVAAPPAVEEAETTEATVEAPGVPEVEAAPPPAEEAPVPRPVPDPLDKIKGIGAVYKRKFNEAGIYTFEQLSELSPEQIADIIQPQSWQKIDAEAWIEQARQFAAAKG